MYVCKRCKKEKTREQMAQARGIPRRHCKMCMNETTKKYWKDNPHRVNFVLGKARGSRGKGFPPEVLLDPDDREKFGMYSWHLNKCGGYAVRRLVQPSGLTRLSFLHREIMNCPADLEVDHINGIPTDCRKANLRIVTVAENRQNVVSIRSNTGCLGVYIRDNRYYATARKDKRHHTIGVFETLMEARIAAIVYRLQNYPGYKARHLLRESPVADFSINIKP
jgi:hypothetical protein